MLVIEKAPDTRAKLQFLQQALGAAGEPVACIETHMSWVLLGARNVLKLKKPVRYPFLDFSTVQARERFVREELRLNRRLAPNVYLGVLALQWDDGGFSLLTEDELPAGGDTIDWLVLMKRLPGERVLDRVIARGELRPSDVEALLKLLVPFYRKAAPAKVSEPEYLERLFGELAEDRRVLTLPHFQLPRAEELVARMGRALDKHQAMLRRRVAAGRIVDGHGDLRPEHVYLIDPPAVIDALEFDARLREADPFDELGFLGLECAMAGDSAIGPQLVKRCAEALDDAPPAALAPLHTARRALLRARLNAAHLLDAEVRTPHQWLPQARRYLQRATDALDALDAVPER